MIGLKDHDEIMGDRILDLAPQTVIAAVETMFAGLQREAEEQDARTRA